MKPQFEAIAARAISKFLLPALLLLAALDVRAQPTTTPSTTTPSATTPPTAGNAVAVTVDGGPAKLINRAFVSVTICAPGSSTDCRTIDHVLISTVSSGLRVLASAISPALTLPAHTADSGAPLGECLTFFNGPAWGSLKLADVQMGNERASSIPIEIVADPQFPGVPQGCSTSAGQPLATVQALGGNGVLGIGPFLQDCGPACARTSNIPPLYFECGASGCQPASVAVARQVPNPVGFFTNDNNGAVLTLPAIPPEGAATVTGLLVFGIGTQTNNALGGATVLTLTPNNGSFTTVYKGQSYPLSFIDANAFATYFFDSSIPLCSSGPGLYCPPSTLSLSADLQGVSGASKTAAFTVANAIDQNTRNPSFAAIDGVAGTDPDHTLFYWGLPFFFGKSVFTAIEGKTTPGGIGPYYAF